MMEEFKYLGTTLRNQNSIQEEIKSRLKSGNACHHAAQNILSSSLLSKNSEIKMYRTIILPGVLYECETWSLTHSTSYKMSNRWDDNMETGIKGTKWVAVNWIELAQDKAEW
jgi:hypothetical protein